MADDETPIDDTFWATWTSAMFRPGELHAGAPLARRWGPIRLALVVGCVAAPVTAITESLVLHPGSDVGSATVRALILSPVTTLASVYFTAALLQFWLIVVRGNKGRFRDTVAAVGYSHAPLLLTVIPVVGLLVGWLWHVVVLCAGLRRAHRTTLGRAIFAVIAGSPILFALVLRAGVVEAFKMPSGSMIPSLLIGDHIFISKLAYGPLVPGTDTRIFSRLPPARGEVMVFKFPENKDQDFIKRAIALPGDKFEVVNGRPVLDGWLVPHCYVGPFKYENRSAELFVEYLGEQSYLTLFDANPDAHTCARGETCDEGEACRAGICGTLQGPFRVAPDEVWVMGDNRNNSHDSRSWRGGLGAGVPFENIKGRGMIVWMSFGPGGGVAQDRLWVSLHGSPKLPAANVELQGALDKCLRERPSAAQTTPPRGAGRE